jgi:hypothetical protein
MCCFAMSKLAGNFDTPGRIACVVSTVTFVSLLYGIHVYKPELQLSPQLATWTQSANLVTCSALLSTSISQAVRIHVFSGSVAGRDDTLGRFYAALTVNTTSMVTSMLIYGSSWGGFWQSIYGYVANSTLFSSQDFSRAPSAL